MKLKDACSSEEKLCQPRQHIEKQSHYFADKGPFSPAYGFSRSHAWMWELDYKENWASKNWCFWTVCWRRLLRVPWPARRSNQSILKEISPEYSLEGVMLKLKLQYFGYLMWRTDSLEIFPWCWERLKAGWEEDNRGWESWMPHRLDGHEFEWTPGVGDGQGGLVCCNSWGCRVGHNWATELNWTEHFIPFLVKLTSDKAVPFCFPLILFMNFSLWT